MEILDKIPKSGSLGKIFAVATVGAVIGVAAAFTTFTSPLLFAGEAVATGAVGAVAKFLFNNPSNSEPYIDDKRERSAPGVFVLAVA